MASAVRRPSTSRRTEPASDGAAGPEVLRVDGRRTHIIDRALDFASLAEQGLSAARIARKRRRSEGYVSIALRLGRAIRGMEPSELEALRSPRITWKLAQRIVREDTDALAVRHQLRAALGGFSTHNVDGRKHRKGRRPAPTADRPVGAAWGWDAAWFARDPLAFVDAHLRYLSGVQRVVQERAARAVGARATDRVPVGQGIRSLQRSLHRAIRSAPQPSAPSQPADGTAPAAPAPTADARALAVLELVARKLAEARDAIAPLMPPVSSPAVGASAAAEHQRGRLHGRLGAPARAERAAWQDALSADLDELDE